MKLHYISQSAVWAQKNAEDVGVCSVSGEGIFIGDPIYVTAEPAFSKWQVLVSAYNDYFFIKHGLAAKRASPIQ